jgi:hypothetical protein
VPLQPPASRIRREVLQRLGVRVYAIGVDKSGLLVGGEEEIRRIQATQNRRKELLRFFRILPEWDSHIAALAVTVLRGPLRRVFFFRSCDFLQMVTQDEPRIGMAQIESARIFFTRQALYNFQVFFQSYTTMTKERRASVHSA